MSDGEWRREQSRQGAPERAGAPSVGTYASIGLQFALALVIFLFFGQWLDRKLGTGPWLTMLAVFLGAGGSFYSMYRRLMTAQERADRAERERRERER